MLYTTLALCKEHDACVDGYRTLIESLPDKWKPDDLIPLTHIIDSNGVADAIWALRATAEPCERFARLFACDCAEHVLHLVPNGEDRPRIAIEIARRYALGESTREELDAAGAAAWAAAWDAAGAAAWAAAWDAAGAAAWAAARYAAWYAAWVARYAARAAARAAERQWQSERLRALLESHDEGEVSP